MGMGHVERERERERRPRRELEVEVARLFDITMASNETKERARGSEGMSRRRMHRASCSYRREFQFWDTVARTYFSAVFGAPLDRNWTEYRKKQTS